MYKLSEAAASDIEAMLTRSLLNFGVERTEEYFQS
jgi:plasmid stabilization system protein ParE